jgi:hypothetical protein
VPALVDTGRGKRLLNAFKKRLTSSHICKTFANKDLLAAYVAADLGREFARRELPRVDLSQTEGIEARPSSMTEGKDWTATRNATYRNNRNVFIAHTLIPSKEPGQLFDVFIYLVAHQSNDPRHQRDNLNDVEYAEFFLGRYWQNQIFRVENKGGMIGVSTAAYGPFLCVAKVAFRGELDEPIVLQRYIDFEMAPFVR